MKVSALVFGFIIAASAVVLTVSLVGLLRIHYAGPPGRRRHRSRYSLRRLRAHATESIRRRIDGPALTARPRVH
jgi:hypothetical protein